MTETEVLLIRLLMQLTFGIGCALIARVKGRHVVGWFFVGFITGLVGLIVSAVVTNLKEQREHDLQARQDRRRLRDDLRQEREKHEAFRRYAMARLDQLDERAGIDTREAEPAEPSLRVLRSDEEEETEVVQAEPIAAWYYETSGEQQGPTSLEQLRSFMRDGAINLQTLVWHESLDEWVPADRIPALRAAS